MQQQPNGFDGVVWTRGLTKRFKDTIAVDAIDLDVARGEFFGVLGPNGAGKSSTMRMLSCVSRPTGGELRILGMNPAKDESRIRARLGVVPQSNNLDRDLTVRENVTTYAQDGEATVAAVQGRGLFPTGLLVRPATLEDVFLRLTGRALVE